MSSARLLTQVVSSVFSVVAVVALTIALVDSLEVYAVYERSHPQLPVEVFFPHFADPATY